MASKSTTINTVTLTCSACGSSAFTKIGLNEYRCNHCQATTLVEDDVAQRLEKILRGMQQPAQPQRPHPAVLLTIALVVAAIFLVPVLIGLMGRDVVPEPPPLETGIDASLVRLSDAQEVKINGRGHLLLTVRNEAGQKIDAPRVTATFRQGELTLGSRSDSPLARTLQHGEYSPVLIALPSDPYDAYTLSVGEPRAARGKQIDVQTSKVQLVRNDGNTRLVGLVTNRSSGVAGSIQISVMLYDEDGRVIGAGSGYATANQLAPQASTPFDVRCDIYREARIAYYDYMVQSEN
ncbi:FxLYD domain-containing protein [Pseudomonadota bacterium AL_CKDN230030165-1A_HGKHYDSX7]